MLERLQATIRRRQDENLRQAEQAFVNEHTARMTCNCRHRGRSLEVGGFGCRILAMGSTQEKAGRCDDLKAQACPAFMLRTPEEELRQQFRAIPQQERLLRWPALGEDAWVLKQIELLSTPGGE
mgnify:CR=1 FL=1